jgi:hypothetical protein
MIRRARISSEVGICTTVIVRRFYITLANFLRGEWEE